MSRAQIGMRVTRERVDKMHMNNDLRKAKLSDNLTWVHEVTITIIVMPGRCATGKPGNASATC